MELSASRAFRTCMQQQPGSLLAAARNVGLDFTHDAMKAMEAVFAKRDASLRPALGVLKQAASGKSAAFHRMANALERFVTAEEEPSRVARDALRALLGEYVLRETSPKHAEGGRRTMLYALSALRALTGAQDFAQVLDTVNKRQADAAQICPEDLDALEEQAVEPAKQAEKGMGPVRVP